MKNIFLVGFMGSGKSSIGKSLSQKLNLNHLDTDRMIEKQNSMSIKEIFKNKDEKFFRHEEFKLITSLSKTKNQIISTGGSAVYSSISMHHLMSFSKVIYIDTPLDVVIERIGVGQERGLAVPEGMTIAEVFEERRPLYEKFSQGSIDGSKAIDDLIILIENIINE